MTEVVKRWRGGSRAAAGAANNVSEAGEQKSFQLVPQIYYLSTDPEKATRDNFQGWKNYVVLHSEVCVTVRDTPLQT